MSRLSILTILSVVSATLFGVADAAAARIDTLSIATRYLDSPEAVRVIVPDAAANSLDSRFPTVYLLNGYSGDEGSWMKLAPLDSLSDLYGMIMVMPDGRDSWYWDSPVNPQMQMESFFVNDLVPFIDSHYPTYATAGQRAITGLSMGGHGSFWLASHHPDVWYSAGSTSGGVDIRPFKNKWKMGISLGAIIDDRDKLGQYTVITQIDRFKNNSLNLIFDCGTEDFFAEVNRNLHRELLEAGVKHDYIERPGGHSGAYWSNSILYHLQFFNEAFKKAAKE